MGNSLNINSWTFDSVISYSVIRRVPGIHPVNYLHAIYFNHSSLHKLRLYNTWVTCACMWACLQAAFWERSPHHSPREEQQRSSLTCLSVCEENEKSLVYMLSSLVFFWRESLFSSGSTPWAGRGGGRGLALLASLLWFVPKIRGALRPLP